MAQPRMRLVALPEFRDDGWLPEGHYAASWEEVIDRLGGSPGSLRGQVARNLLSWKDEVKARGVSGWLLLDGSFVSAKEDPSDFDALLVIDEETRKILENDIEARRLLDYSECKNRGFDLLYYFAATVRDYPSLVGLDLWDRDKRTGKLKGVLEVSL